MSGASSGCLASSISEMRAMIIYSVSLRGARGAKRSVPTIAWARRFAPLPTLHQFLLRLAGVVPGFDTRKNLFSRHQFLLAVHNAIKDRYDLVAQPFIYGVIHQ